MMKIIHWALPILLIASPTYADDHEIWWHIQRLYDLHGDLQQQVNNMKTTPVNHHIGEIYHGGIIFWVDETGKHGLIASKNDLNQGKGIQWRNGDSGSRITNAKADGIGAGENNTRLVISQQTIDHQSGQFAALIAANYSITGDGQTSCANSNEPCYGGWYLPSAYELKLLSANLGNQGITQFQPDLYWSSTEINVKNAWMQNFATGEQIASDKASTLGQVRAISRF